MRGAFEYLILDVNIIGGGIMWIGVPGGVPIVRKTFLRKRCEGELVAKMASPSRASSHLFFVAAFALCGGCHLMSLPSGH